MNIATLSSPVGDHRDREHLLGQMYSYLTLSCIVNMYMRGDSKTAQHVAARASAADDSSSNASSMPAAHVAACYDNSEV